MSNKIPTAQSSEAVEEDNEPEKNDGECVHPPVKDGKKRKVLENNDVVNGKEAKPTVEKRKKRKFPSKEEISKAR